MSVIRHARTFSTVALLALLAAAAFVSWRNYHSVQGLFEADAPAAVLQSTPRIGTLSLGTVAFVSSDGLRLAAWYVPSRNGINIILAHGTNGDRSMMLPEVRLLADAGFGVLAFDWPGLGQSQGEVRWDSQARHALIAAIDWLASRPGVDSSRIGGLGFSIGGFILTQVAAEDERLGAIVLEAAPSSFQDYLEEHDRRWGYLSEWAALLAMQDTGLLDPGFQPMSVIARIAPRPVMLLGGTRDADVPARMVTKLFTAAREPKALWILKDAGHGNYSAIAPVEYARKLTGFFAAGLRGLRTDGGPVTVQPAAGQSR
jgi:dipeptidyl aminopeptidase/acylaminoacyl peptidase